MLCYRCNHRSQYLDSLKGDNPLEHRPRSECGDIETSKYVCYMYEPVQPVILKKQKGDKRPRFAGWMLSAREEFVGLADFVLDLKKVKDGSILYWRPK